MIPPLSHTHSLALPLPLSLPPFFPSVGQTLRFNAAVAGFVYVALYRGAVRTRSSVLLRAASPLLARSPLVVTPQGVTVQASDLRWMRQAPNGCDLERLSLPARAHVCVVTSSSACWALNVSVPAGNSTIAIDCNRTLGATYTVAYWIEALFGVGGALRSASLCSALLCAALLGVLLLRSAALHF